MRGEIARDGKTGAIAGISPGIVVPAAESADLARPFFLPMDGRRTGSLIAALGPLLAEGGRAYCLDGGNVFNPLDLARWLRQAGHDPMPILAKRLFVSRSFTCHQFAGSVRTMLAPLAREAAPPPVFILGTDHLFLDEDIPLFERRFLFERILGDAAELVRRGLPMLFTCGGEANNPWTRRIREAAIPAPGIAMDSGKGGMIDGPHDSDV